MASTLVKIELQNDKIDSEMIDYMAKHGKVKAGELADLIGIGVSSIRVRLFQLMAQGLVNKEKAIDHQVWFFVTEKEAESSGNSIDGTSRNGTQYIDLILLALVRRLYTRVCSALERADQEKDEYCLLLSNFADDTAAFISGMDLLREAAK